MVTREMIMEEYGQTLFYAEYKGEQVWYVACDIEQAKKFHTNDVGNPFPVDLDFKEMNYDDCENATLPVYVGKKLVAKNVIDLIAEKKGLVSYTCF